MKIKIVSKLCILALAVGAMSLAGSARAETTSTGDSSSLSTRDKTFMKKAAKGGTMEVALGRLAEQNAQSEDVKSFGKRMVTDHGDAKSKAPYSIDVNYPRFAEDVAIGDTVLLAM